MSKELTKQEAGALPDYLKGYSGPLGTEDIGNEDVTIPRIKLGQALTPEVKDGDVKIGDLFLNVTGQVLAKAGEPLRFIPVATGKEYILWSPERGEGILARGHRTKPNGGAVRYAWDKPDQTFHVKIPKGPSVEWKTKKYVDENGMDKFGSSNPADPESSPAATAHHNIIVSLPDHDDMVVALSLSKSQEKRAKDFNAMIKMSSVPMFARIFEVKSVDEISGSDEYKNYKFSPAGFLEDQTKFEALKELHEQFSAQGYKVDQSEEEATESSDGF